MQGLQPASPTGGREERRQVPGDARRSSVAPSREPSRRSKRLGVVRGGRRLRDLFPVGEGVISDLIISRLGFSEIRWLI
jgi:hypothetical protein